MKLYWSLCLAVPLSLILHRGVRVETIELQVFPINGPEQSCPEKVMAYQILRPWEIYDRWDGECE